VPAKAQMSISSVDCVYTSPLGSCVIELTLGPLALAFVGASGRED
jgi:hypothetical protein